MFLDTTTKTLELVLGAAKTTTDMPVTVDYVVLTATTTVPTALDTASNGVTAVTILTAPTAATQYKVNGLSIFNADTVVKVVTVRLNNNTTLRNIVSVTLQVGDTLGYTDTQGWYVTTSAGTKKMGFATAGEITNIPAGTLSSTTVQAALNELDTEKVATTLIGAANGLATLDASSLIPLAQIPPSALERMVVVANQTARYALTTATVQNGDTVKQTDTGEMWFVIDQTNLGNNAGYSVYTAGTATNVAVGGITGLGTGVSTALAVTVGTVGAPVVNGGAMGTPSSGVTDNLTTTTSAAAITDTDYVDETLAAGGKRKILWTAVKTYLNNVFGQITGNLSQFAAGGAIAPASINGVATDTTTNAVVTHASLNGGTLPISATTVRASAINNALGAALLSAPVGYPSLAVGNNLSFQDNNTSGDNAIIGVNIYRNSGGQYVTRTTGYSSMLSFGLGSFTVNTSTASNAAEAAPTWNIPINITSATGLITFGNGAAVIGAIRATTTIKSGEYTVGTLPANAIGTFAYVTDQLTAAAAKGVAPTGGGNVVCYLMNTGAGWVGI